MTQKELLTALKEWQKKKEIPKFDTNFKKNVHTHNFKKLSKHRHCRDTKHCFVDSLPYALHHLRGRYAPPSWCA